MGTALTEDHLRLLKRATRRIVLALDPGAAGTKAALRGVGRPARPRPPGRCDLRSRGFIRYEGRLNTEIQVVALPEGKDPDEIVLQAPGLAGDPARRQAGRRVRPGRAHRGADLDDSRSRPPSRGKSSLIEDVADPVERRSYRQSMKRRLRVDERSLEGARSSSRPRRG
jgi:DNA primase